MQTYAGFSFIFLTFLVFSVFLYMVETQRKDLEDAVHEHREPPFLFSLANTALTKFGN